MLLQMGKPGRSFHAGGSFPMRSKPGAFETDTLRAPGGLRRVHAVDATVLPSIPATTITLTVMANAHRIGWDSTATRSPGFPVASARCYLDNPFAVRILCSVTAGRHEARWRDRTERPGGGPGGRKQAEGRASPVRLGCPARGSGRRKEGRREAGNKQGTS